MEHDFSKNTEKIYTFVKEYTEMDINGTIINCPYWMNKIVRDKVVLRGFLNGKGSAYEIRNEFIRRLHTSSSRNITAALFLKKFAKRERIGIDCSGFVYQVLNELIHLKYMDNQIKDLSEVFIGGINKTNVKTLTDVRYCLKIDNLKKLRLGDLIRLWNGKHVAIILKVNSSEIVYAHSSHLSTQIQGVHLGIIRIIDRNKLLEEQNWLEQTRHGENFGKKYFNPQKGDGIFRLKIFS